MNTQTLRTHLAEGGVALFNLSDRTFLRLSGGDRVRYLNGQVSNDIRKMSPGEVRPACVMTAKGKMNAYLWVTPRESELLIDAEASLREALAMRLERYIISDDATLEDQTEAIALYHLIGSPVATESWHPDFTLPEGVSVGQSRRYGMRGIDIIGPTAAVESLVHEGLGALSRLSKKVDTETANTFRIEQGIPSWGAELDENTIPVEARLEADAIDYHKGCYIGQEIISRIKSVGHVNRSLTGFLTEEVIPEGTRFILDGRDVGGITSSAWSFALEKGVALGYLRRSVDVPQLEAGYPVEVRSLPLIA